MTSIHNFCGYYGKKEVGSSGHLTHILGDNGDGKTTFFDALQWLFNTTIDKGNIDHMSEMRKSKMEIGEKEEVSVAMLFEHDGEKSVEKSFSVERVSEDFFRVGPLVYRGYEASGSERIQVSGKNLLDRCCFTIIQPTDDGWAFDMFQSLNATGTPLTAIETFKPTVVNTVDNESGHQFKDSDSDKFFKKVEDFLSEATTAAQKNKRTNDYLTSFFVAYDGRTMSTHFSYQRKVLNSVYESLSSFDDKENFVKKMGNYAEFYQKWLKYDGKDNSTFPGIGSSEDADIASMLILFLKDSKHKMAITMLGSVYESVIENGTAAKDDFINVVKAVATYYFLWRSAFSNSGLDSTYREFFKKNKDFTVDTVKLYLRDVLKQRGIDTLESWKSKTSNYLKYDSTGKDVLRLALLIAAHDTIPDENNKGLVKIGRSGCSKYLAVSKWLSPDLKTIEHIAPQTNKEKAWDESLYDTHIEPFQSLGNLTLLPQDLNSSAGNKGWKEKLLYYQSVAEKDPAKINDIENRASALGISLNSSTIELLKESHFNEHLASISLMSAEDSWDRELVERRTDRMLDIIWERISKWIL